ncbi:MAG: WD40/YVTN/BNR-like repeat-containing protein [Bryobacteraceae bacterium]
MVTPKCPLPGAIPLGMIVLWLCLFGSLGSAQSGAPPVQAPYSWAPVRIVAGGYIPGLIAHPTQSGLIYARTDMGGVYRWNPILQQWIPLLDFNPPADYSFQGPESVALDPADPNRVYIAAGMGGSGPFAILASTDQGATFSTYPVSFYMGSNDNGRSVGERLAVNPFNPSELFMGTRQQGLWKSEDHAQTWTKVGSFPVLSSSDDFGVQWVLFDPVNSGTVYAGVYTASKIYQSTDDGATWNALPGQPLSWPYSVGNGTRAPSPMRAVLNPDGNLYVTYGDYPGPNGMNYGLVEQFNVSTGTWTNVTPPVDAKDGETAIRGGFCGISQDPHRQGTLAVATLDRWWPTDTVYITHDGGKTWIDLGAITSAAGIDGPQGPSFYFNPSVFQPISPWLTFGNPAPDATAGFGWWMSSLLIDPVNPDHLMYATGASVFATSDVSEADSGQAPTWYVQGLGIEQTAVTALISPTQGAHLLSGVGDIGGFRHDDFAMSPAGGMYYNPAVSTTDGMDWAGQNPQFVVRTGIANSASTSPCNYGGYSTDGGTNWTPFGACAAGGANSDSVGTIAVDASGTMLMWTTPSSAGAPQYSTDNGGSWNVAGGNSGLHMAVADKVTPQVFYAFDGVDFFSTTASGGKTFSKVNKTTFLRGTQAVPPVASFARAGDLWLPLGDFGLYHSTDGGVTWTPVTDVLEADQVSVGAANPRARTGVQSVFIFGVPAVNSPRAIYRSDDNGSTWVRVNDTAHQYGGPSAIVADTRVYGRVYLGMNGRGIVCGDISIDPLGGGGAGPQ